LFQTIKYTDKYYLYCLIQPYIISMNLTLQYNHSLKIRLYLNITLN